MRQNSKSTSNLLPVLRDRSSVDLARQNSLLSPPDSLLLRPNQDTNNSFYRRFKKQNDRIKTDYNTKLENTNILLKEENINQNEFNPYENSKQQTLISISHSKYDHIRHRSTPQEETNFKMKRS